MQFIKTRFKADKTLEHAFMAEFTEMSDEDINEKYHSLIQNLASAVRGRSKFINYQSAKKLNAPLRDLVKKANALLQQNNIAESLAISKALLEKIPPILDSIEESDGTIHTMMYEVFEIFDTIIAKAPPLLKDDLFSYFLDEYATTRYHRSGFDENIIDRLFALISDKEQERQVFQLIDKAIATPSPQGSSAYEIQALIEAKIEYLQSKKRSAEAIELMEQYKHIAKFRELVIRAAIGQQQYDLAKTLCLEGIDQSKQRGWHTILTPWKNLLLEIAVLQQKPDDIRALATELFMSTHSSMEHYYTLKSSYSPEEWPLGCQKLISKIKKQFGHYGQAERFCARIFAAEADTDSLLKALQNNATNIDFVDTYAKHLYSSHPEELLACYEQGILALMKEAGRSYYEQAATYLQKMHSIPGGSEKARALIDQLREQFSKRKAMKEVFDKAFPKTTSS